MANFMLHMTKVSREANGVFEVNSKQMDLSKVKLYVKREILREITLVDSPGFSESETLNKYTESYASTADLIIQV